AGAGIDEDREPVPAQKKALDRDGEESVGPALKARHEPVAVGVEMRLRAIRKNLERRQQWSFGLDDALHRDVAEGPLMRGCHARLRFSQSRDYNALRCLPRNSAFA